MNLDIPEELLPSLAMLLFPGELRFLQEPLLEQTLEDPQARFAHKTLRYIKRDFFISYRHRESQRYATSLSTQLSQLGFKVFLDIENNLGSLTEDEVHFRLRKEVSESATIIHLGSPNAFDGEWTRAESEMSTEGGDQEGRLVLTVDLIVGPVNPHTAQLFHMRRMYQAVQIHEEDAASQDTGTASRTTLVNLALAVSMFRSSLSVRKWIQLHPKDNRARIFYQSLAKDKACTKWLRELLELHPFLLGVAEATAEQLFRDQA